MDFSDVTLISEEGQQIDAHRVILSACSPFFKSVLSKNKHPYPMIYMRGLKSKDLVAIIDFMYTGEANIFQEDLDAFLNIAEEQRLKGLTGVKDEEVKDHEVITSTVGKTDIKEKQPKNSWKNKNSEIAKDTFEELLVKQDIYVIESSTDMVPFDKSDDVDYQVTSMMTRNNDSKWSCTVCGKIVRDKTNLYQHIEANHIEGVSHPCNHCVFINFCS